MMTNEELKECRGSRNQAEMAKHLDDTPLSTYRKWEQGVRKVPGWVEDRLRPRERVIPGLTLEAVYALDRKARAEQMTLEQFIGKVLTDLAKTALAIALLICFGHQVIHPEDGQPRRFGRRRDDSAMICDAEAEA